MPENKGASSFDLQRFLDAQEPIYTQVRAELAAAEKRSHWMWFIFPQIRGLGSSPMAQRFAISGGEEAVAYLRHPVLGARLRECTALVNAAQGRSVNAIFGTPDDLKFRSSMTLFAAAAARQVPTDTEARRIFDEALSKYFGGQPDQATLSRLG